MPGLLVGCLRRTSASGRFGPHLSLSATSFLPLTLCWNTATHPLLVPQMPAPTGVVSPPLPTTAAVPTCGTKMKLPLDAAATECELEDCGTFSIKVLVAASITPRTAPPCGQPAASPQSRLDPV